MTDQTIAAKFAEFAVGLQFEAVPTGLIEKAKLHILDTLGCAIAAARSDSAKPTLNALLRLGTATESVAIGQAERLGLRDAILFNGGLANTLDYDDTYIPALNHISCGTVPLVLALATREGATGRAMLLAYVLALEVNAHISFPVPGASIMGRGFSPSGMLNGFGNALAAGHLMDLDDAALINSQGIAASFMAGTMEGLSEGAWTKRLYPGGAGVAGLTSAILAAEGFKAPSRPYEGDAGLYKLLLGPDAVVDLNRVTEGLGQSWEFEKVAIKLFPIVHHAHSVIECGIRLRVDDEVKPEDIEDITVLVHEGQVARICEPAAKRRHPPNAHAGLFSIYHTLATAIVKGGLTLDETDDDTLNDPKIWALRERIGYEIDPKSNFPEYFSGGLIAHLKDGRIIRYSEPYHRGSDQRPLEPKLVIEKFRNNAARLYPKDRVDALIEVVMSLDREGQPADVSALLGAPPSTT